MKNFGRWIKIGILLCIVAVGFYIIPSRQLNVNYISQYPNMPNGCEITSLAMVMNHKGYNVTKEYLNNNFLEKSGYSNANPDRAYIGNPYKSGYYCYAAPIANAANQYFKTIGDSSIAEDKTGMSIIGVLNNIVFNKKPVIVWYTVDDKKPEYGIGKYKDEDNQTHKLYVNSHCIVVEGTGMGNIKVVDPIKGKRDINILEFVKLYYQMGQRAVVI